MKYQSFLIYVSLSYYINIFVVKLSTLYTINGKSVISEIDDNHEKKKKFWLVLLPLYNLLVKDKSFKEI